VLVLLVNENLGLLLGDLLIRDVVIDLFLVFTSLDGEYFFPSPSSTVAPLTSCPSTLETLGLWSLPSPI